jgi:hypothetical protein
MSSKKPQTALFTRQKGKKLFLSSYSEKVGIKIVETPVI